MAQDRPAEPTAPRETGIARLVAAERAWRAALEAAEDEASRLVAAARVADTESDAALEREIGELCSRRTDAAEGALRDRCARLRDEAAERAARYDGVGAAREREIVEAIVARLWPSAAATPSAPVAGGAA